ncbi:MAG: c-type cytochrome [Pseudomonadales bacterium]|nr:c-type cytochrome [Pseudomonadales bacterium]
MLVFALLLGGVFAAPVCQAADAVAGKRLYPVCTACHGAAGQGNRGMGGPKLAGQQGFYLLKQLQNFQSGARGMAPGDAKGRQMAAMSKRPALSSATALQNLVAYLETLPAKPSTPTVMGDVARGKNLYATCVSCHGEAAQGLETMAAPRLAGQSDWYLVNQLKNFASGQRGYASSDHSGRQMRAMMTTLSGPSDYRDVVAYINTLAP